MLGEPVDDVALGDDAVDALAVFADDERADIRSRSAANAATMV